MKNLTYLFRCLFRNGGDATAPTLRPPAEHIFLRIPSAILHLIDHNQSIELAAGDFAIIHLLQGENIVGVFARVGTGDDHAVKWPLAHDDTSVKLDDSHYYFSLQIPNTEFGLTFTSKGQGELLAKLDGVLEEYSSFSVRKVADEVSLVAPNVEDYSGLVAKGIAEVSGNVIRGILWCGDVAVNGIKRGEEMMKRRMSPCVQVTEVSKDALNTMERVKRVTKMSEKVVSGVYKDLVMASGFKTGPIINSVAGKKFFGLIPGEVALATLEGFGKISDAVKVAGKNVLQTSSVVTTGVVSHKYGEQAAEITHDGLDAAGHAIGTAFAVFKIGKALNPTNFVKPKTLAKLFAKSAIAEMKTNKQLKFAK